MPWEPLRENVDNTRDLSDVLDVLHRRLGLARPDVLVTLQSHWTALLGPDLAAHCTLDSVRYGTLVIGVDDPAIADHLKWSAGELVAAANEICGGEAVSEIRVTVTR
ncbi:MAG: DUF721 domain-containing protein [Microthrixaceae bacterium]